MAEPQLVAESVVAMKQATDIPITVKTRLGIDEQDDYEFVREFVDAIYQVEVDAVVLHARKAWLKGLSPKENRDIPPLEYAKVYQIKQEFPDLHLDINGGIHSLKEAENHLQQVDGVMMGRALYHQPYILAEADKRIFNDDRLIPGQHEIVELMLPYIEMRMKEGRPLKSITRHMLGLFQGLPGARRWRRHLSENAHLPGAGIEVVRDALKLIG